MAATNNLQAPSGKKKWSERDTTRFVELYIAEQVLLECECTNIKLRCEKCSLAKFD